MNEYLAQLYGTGGYTEEDLEKVAAYEMLTKLAEEEGVDLDALDDETVEELVNDLSGSADTEGPQLYEDEEGNLLAQGDDGELYYVDPEDYMDEEEKLAAAQLEEADFLGRTMAHAYAQEMGLIEASYDDDDEYIEEYDGSDFDKVAAAYAEDLLKEAAGAYGESGWHPDKGDPGRRLSGAARKRRMASQLAAAEKGMKALQESGKKEKKLKPFRRKGPKMSKGTQGTTAFGRTKVKRPKSKLSPAAKKYQKAVGGGGITDAQAKAHARQAKFMAGGGPKPKGALHAAFGGRYRQAAGLAGKGGLKNIGRAALRVSPELAAGGLAAGGAYKLLSKQASIDEAIEERAYELLALEGYLE